MRVTFILFVTVFNIKGKAYMQLLNRIKSRVIHEAHVRSIKNKTSVEKGLEWLKAYRVTAKGVVPSYTFQRRPMATKGERGYILVIFAWQWADAEMYRKG